MATILEYYVMRNEGGMTMWYAGADAWTPHFHQAAAFAKAATADKAAKARLRKLPGDDRVFFVMGCVERDPGD